MGITGASGVIYGVRLLDLLRDVGGVETYLIVSDAAGEILLHEVGETVETLKGRARHFYGFHDFKAPISSGSYIFDAMVIVPCSMKTAAGIVSGYTDNLILRAADVALKEGRKLIIVPRETPLSTVHLRNLYRLALMGVHVIPAMPAFYHKPTAVSQVVDHVVGKVLDALGIKLELFMRWGSNGA
ncbi:MAG: UbiX family flavin prenyltransferase [Candidatus Bathyarchaeia archaeon]